MMHSAKVRFACAVALACSLPGAVFASSASFSKTFLSTTSSGVQHADLNNDGREDYVFLNVHGGFDVRLSTGDGVYASPVAYTIPGGADAGLISIADFNKDGSADLVVLGTDSALHLFLNNGHGSFSQKTKFANSKFAEASSLLVADFNRDGAMDLAVKADPGVIMVFGNGKSGFSLGPSAVANNDGPFILGDFDGDGNADIGVTDLDNYDTVQVLYGNGKGNFPTRSLLQASGGHFTFTPADLNGDGKMDIIGTQFYPNAHTVSIFYGSASRTWTKTSAIPLVHCSGEFAAAADVNGDGVNDVILTEADCNNNSQAGNAYVGVITGKGNASFSADQIVFSGRFYLDALSAIRAERNTKPDITFENCTKTPCAINGNTNQALLLNTTSGNFPSCAPPNTFKGINMCSPVVNSAVASPVSFKIGAAGQVAMRDVEVWVDGKKLVEQLDGYSNYTFLNHSLSLSAGSHAVAIYAASWDQSLQKKTFTLKVK